jgi:hypothetical protein
VTAGGWKMGEGKRVDVGGRRSREGVVFRRQVCDDPQQELFARVEPSVLSLLGVEGQRQVPSTREQLEMKLKVDDLRSFRQNLGLVEVALRESRTYQYLLLKFEQGLE